MDVKDLMIGDWVHYWILNINAKVNDVMSTGRLGIRFIDSKGKEGYIHGVICETVKPIPLTAEILKKNGFEKRDGEYQDVFYYYEDLDLLIDDRLEPCGYTLYGVFGFQIKYVHELQHALRLCGIEKKILL